MPSLSDHKEKLRQAKIAALKEEEAKRRAIKRERQIELCYRQYVPPQIKGFPELCR